MREIFSFQNPFFHSGLNVSISLTILIIAVYFRETQGELERYSQGLLLAKIPNSGAEEASRSRPVSRVGGLSRMSGRPPRYALTRRKGRPASMLHLVKQCEAREA